MSGIWGADEEVSDGGSLRVIVLGYDGLPIQPVAPPSTNYIPGLEEPQTPPVPQDQDEREPMFIQPHDLDYVPEPIYPEYMPLEDEHVFSVEEQPLPPVDSPTAESPGTQHQVYETRSQMQQAKMAELRETDPCEEAAIGELVKPGQEMLEFRSPGCFRVADSSNLVVYVFYLLGRLLRGMLSIRGFPVASP
ncbi:hypothetical protein Tco_1030729 [Tanacetum coccineum]|uniref:Uncharacterized protein n=1 Tax=Tanacetum coccineum TaxID=301880 RepID=A0ABQ5G718_9ASTR